MEILKRMLRARQFGIHQGYAGLGCKFGYEAPYFLNPHQRIVGTLNNKKRGG